MKIIFLDIDGVLNNADDSDFHVHKGGSYCYSPKCVENLNLILGTTDAKIVVSSTWRLGQSVEQLQCTILDMGIRGEVVGKTGSLSHIPGVLRGNEILAWIKGNSKQLGQEYYDFNSYVILDDDSDMLLWQKDNFVKTDGYVGLTLDNAQTAIAILNNFAIPQVGL